MRQYLNELKTITDRLEAMVNHSLDKSEKTGDDWCFLSDALIDAKEKLSDTISKIHLPEWSE